MKDVIIETGRHAWYGSRKREESKLATDLSREDLDEIEAPRRGPKSNWKDKSFGDRLMPLYRFLEKNVGKPWDDVYSELCQRADKRSIRGFHLRQHVEQYVATNLGDPYQQYSQFRVDDNGILQRGYTYSKWQRKSESDPDVKRIDQNTELRRIDGVWYKIVLTPATDAMKTGDVTDKVTKKPVFRLSRTLPEGALYPVGLKIPGRRRGPALYASAKEQLNKKQLKKYGLKK
jgi:hypothetical protein